MLQAAPADLVVLGATNFKAVMTPDGRIGFVPESALTPNQVCNR
jgi:hypothetical protein